MLLLDSEDQHLAARAWRNATGYYYIGKQLVHRIIMGCKPGDGLEVDHVNSIRDDCRKSNLQIVPRGTNNQKRKLRASSTGFIGVSKVHKSSKFMARARWQGANTVIGYFVEPDEAAAAYDIFVLERHGDHALTNFSY